MSRDRDLGAESLKLAITAATHVRQRKEGGRTWLEWTPLTPGMKAGALERARLTNPNRQATVVSSVPKENRYVVCLLTIEDDVPVVNEVEYQFK